MAKFAPIYAILSILLMLSLYSGYGSCSRSYVGGDHGETNTMPNEKTWCVAAPGTSEAALKSNIDYACSKVDCASIQNGGPCFLPNNMLSHASYAMNAFYQENGKTPEACDFNKSGKVVNLDPSYDSCTYPSS